MFKIKAMNKFTANIIFLYVLPIFFQSAQIANEVYSFEWYNFESARVKKGIVNIIQRSQDMPVLSAGRLLELNLDNCTTVRKLFLLLFSMSYCVLFKLNMYFLQMLKFAFSVFTLLRAEAFQDTASS